MADAWTITPPDAAPASPSSGMGGVGAQTDDYARQIGDVNKRIDGLIKDATLPTGPDKETYDALVKQRDSLSAKAKELGTKTEKAGAKAPDLDAAVDKASTPAKGWTIEMPEAEAPTEAAAPQGPTTKDTAAVVQPEAKDPSLGITFGGSKVTSSEIPPGPSWEEAQKTLLELDKQGVPKTDPRYQQAVKDKALGLQRLSSGGFTSMANIPGAGGAAVRGAAKGLDKVASPIIRTVKTAASKAPEKAAEELRSSTIGETQAAGAKVEKTAQASAAQAEADRALAQGKLDQATKALDSDVAADLKKVEALRAQRTPAAKAPDTNPTRLPQFVRGKEIEGEVPARDRAAPPRQRAQGLSGELDQAIRTAQQKVQDHASRLYTMGAKTAGETPIPVSGLKETIDDFMNALPEDIRMSVPPLLRNIQNSEAETMTVKELQSLRTTLRSLGNNPKLTPDLKSGPYRLLANKADALLHAPSNPTAVKQGVRIIDAGDKFYAKNMAQFRSKTLQNIADDVRDGLPMDASKVLSTVAQGGESGTLKRIVQLGGDRIRVQLRNADFDNVMAGVKTPEGKIDGKKLLKAVEERKKDGSLTTLYGKEGNTLVQLANKAASKDLGLKTAELQPGKFQLALRRATELQEKVPQLAKAAETAQAKATPEAVAEAKRDITSFGTQLRETNLAPKDVATKANSVVNSLFKKGLISQKDHDLYLRQVKEVGDKFADRTKARQRVTAIMGSATIAAFGYKYYRELRNLIGF